MKEYFITDTEDLSVPAREQNLTGPKPGRQDSALFILKHFWETDTIDLKDTSKLYIINRPQADMKKGNRKKEIKRG